MSCITELLKLKGTKEYLISDTVAIEAGGIYKGYEWLVTFTNTGHRCGYVALSETHKLYRKDLGMFDDALDAIGVHGGISWVDSGAHIIELFLDGFHCSDIWLGFDAAHGHDSKDYDLMKKLWPIKNSDEFYEKTKEVDKFMSVTLCGHSEKKIRTKEYMTKQCKWLVTQLGIENAL